VRTIGRTGHPVGDWAAANDVEFAYVPFHAFWLNRIWVYRPSSPRSVTSCSGTDHGSHHEQVRMIRRYIAWRNRNSHDRLLRAPVNRAKVA
jgi:hypothetical protein